MSSTSRNVDRLSNLPEDVLSHILSRVPTKYAVRTCILSKIWRYRWTSVTNLDFDDKHFDDKHSIHGLNTLSTFVECVLVLCKTPQVNLFRLSFSDIWVQKRHISMWINEAVRLNVRKLDIKVIMLELPLSLFTCQTLTELKLDYSPSELDGWECPSPTNLPCLKTLDIVVFSNPSVTAFKLIQGCPILESLSLKVIWRNDEEEYVFSIPTLKRLKLTFKKCASIINKVVFDVPNLEYLFVGGVLCSLFVMNNVSSLVEASISFFEVRFKHLWVDLLKGVSGSKSLSWSCYDRLQTDSSLKVPFTSPLPIFINLKLLELKRSFRTGWLLSSQILESSSQLVYLCIEEPEGSCWFEPNLVPAFMLVNLKTIKFTKYKGRKCDMQFLEYVLANAKVLETLMITCEGSNLHVETRLFVKLFKLPRVSKYCEIHFIGKWCRYCSSRRP